MSRPQLFPNLKITQLASKIQFQPTLLSHRRLYKVGLIIIMVNVFTLISIINDQAKAN